MVEDLALRKQAKDWFSVHAPGVVDIRYYTGPVGSAIVTGHMGLDVSGRVVALVSLDALERETKQPSVKPLLVLSYRQSIDRDNLERIRASMQPIKDNGWMCVVLDEMSRDGAQAFDVPLPTLDTLRTDSIIEMLDALRRGREGQGAIEGGSISRS